MARARIDRRTFNAAAALAAVLAVPAVRAQSGPEKVRVGIAVGGKAALYYLPLTIAEQLGYFKAEGLEVQISDFAGGTDSLRAVLDGAADVVSGAYEHTINLQSQGRLFQAFVLMGRAPQIAVGVSTRTLPGFQSLADLRGARIGVTAPGSSTNMVANLLLARAGVKADEVRFVGVGSSAGALTAMRAGRIDAISNLDPLMTLLEQKGEVRIVADTRSLKGTLEVFGGPMPASCLYAPLEFVQKHPATVQALANAVVRALKWLQTAAPSDLVRAVPEAYLLGDRALYLACFDRVREAIAPDGLLPEEGGPTALRALASFDPALKTARIDLDKTYTNEFSYRAKERFKA